MILICVYSTFIYIVFVQPFYCVFFILFCVYYCSIANSNCILNFVLLSSSIVLVQSTYCVFYILFYAYLCLLHSICALIFVFFSLLIVLIYYSFNVFFNISCFNLIMKNHSNYVFFYYLILFIYSWKMNYILIISKIKKLWKIYDLWKKNRISFQKKIVWFSDGISKRESVWKRHILKMWFTL